jgi:single-stranded DNA-binding protein
MTSSGHQDSPAPTDLSHNVTGRNDDTSGSPEEEKDGEVQLQQLQGRLGRDPWFRTDGAQPIGGFPLAVNNQQGETTWHKVVVFDAAAEQLQEAVSKRSIGKGKLVDVTGQTVIREESKANGGVTKSPEFHATAVARAQNTRPPR